MQFDYSVLNHQLFDFADITDMRVYPLLKFPMVHYFNNSLFMLHISMLCFLLLHCCFNNPPQFLEDQIKTGLFSILAFLVILLQKLRCSRTIYGTVVKLRPILNLLDHYLNLTLSLLFQF